MADIFHNFSTNILRSSVVLNVFHTTIKMFLMGNCANNGRAIAQAVSRRPPTAAAGVQTRVWSCGIL
jgi:hypothetical protein